MRPPGAALDAGCRQRKGFSFANCGLEPSFRPVRRLSDSLDTFLAAGKRPRREVAVILHRVPAVLDAAHVGFVFADVMGRGHSVLELAGLAPSSEGSAPQAGREHLETDSFRRRSQPQFIGDLFCLPTGTRAANGGSETSVRRRFSCSSRTSCCLPGVQLSGVPERKAQWRVEKMRRQCKRSNITSTQVPCTLD
jgi:hypothetical protein